MSILEMAFWVAAILIAYTYAGYPLLVGFWSRLRPRPTRLRPFTPSVSIVVVACNEADCIRQKVDNLLALDYPPEHCEVIVASDGSDDRTVAQVEGCSSPRVHVIEFRQRRGKTSVLNDVIPRARGDIVVLADARQRFDPHALRALVSHFADPTVGAVGGELVLVDTHAHGAELGQGVGAYWRYEKFIRRHESRVDSTVGVSGAIYAIRRELFSPLPPDIILDDVLIPMRIVRQGYRVLFEAQARAYDRTAPTAQAEFRRKVRTLAGNFQLFLREPWLLSPRANRVWLQTISHKALRLLAPPLLAVAFFTSAALAWRFPYAVLFAAQLVFYAAAVLGFRLRNRASKPFFFNVPYTFCVLNWATVVGLVRWATGRQSVMWQTNNVR